jgi:hypothetical protein
MTVSTFTQPDNTTQTGSAYKTAIDGAAHVHHRIAGAFACHQQNGNSPDAPDMTVVVDAGALVRAGLAPLEVAQQSTSALTAPSGNPRYDIVYIDNSTGTVGVAAGAEAASPSDPAIPAGKTAVARVRLTVGMTEITNVDIDDLRLFVAPPASAISYSSGSPQILDAENVQDAIDELADSIGAAPLRGYIDGLKLSNDTTDATNDIGIATGQAADSTNAVLLELGSSLIKQLDANWSPGTNQGMRYSGAAIADTTYYIWLVGTAAGATDIYATPVASATTASAALTLLQAETGGSSYIYARYIGVIVRSAGAIVVFRQNGDEFLLDTPLSTTSASVASASGTNVTLSGMPTGLKLYALVGGTMITGAGGGSAIIVYSPDQTNVPAPSAIGMNTVAQNQSTTCSSFGRQPTLTNVSGQIVIRSSGNAPDLYLTLHGWIDPRGKNA